MAKETYIKRRMANETVDVELASAERTRPSDDSKRNDDDDAMGGVTDSSEYVEMWIDLFLGRKGHEYFCDVDPEYITDRFNLINLQKTVSKFTQVVQYIVDELDEFVLEGMSHARLEQLESDARKFYTRVQISADAPECTAIVNLYCLLGCTMCPESIA